MSSMYIKIWFPEDFEKKHEAYKAKILSPNHKISPFGESFEPVYGEFKPELTVGELQTFNDGTVRFKGEIISMRGQLKELCRLFMENNQKLVTFDDVRDQIIDSKKRSSIANSTISKYVSELRSKLRKHFGSDVLPNQKKEGWIPDIKKMN